MTAVQFSPVVPVCRGYENVAVHGDGHDEPLVVVGVVAEQFQTTGRLTKCAGEDPKLSRKNLRLLAMAINVDE
jgi:hypothetical protein